MDKRLSVQGTLVKVQGLIGAAEQHNGKTGGVVVPYKASNGMVGVTVMEDDGFRGTFIEVKPENLLVFDMPNPLERQGRAEERPLFRIGTSVIVQGLLGTKQHNGKTGKVIVPYDEDSGRVGVMLSDGVTKINVKPENLVLEARTVQQFLPHSTDEILAMTKLKLNGQGITDLDGIEFMMMGNLVDLDLEDNEIVCLAPQIFPKSLKRLNLSHNRIKSLKECFFSKTRLQQFQQLPPEFEEFREGVDDTRLEAVKLPKKLEILLVADNEIDSIDEVVFPLIL